MSSQNHEYWLDYVKNPKDAWFVAEKPDDNVFLQRAIQTASKNVADLKGGPFGAVIIDRNGNILSDTGNMVVSNLDPTAHAEIVAIRSACSKLGSIILENCILYSSCEPCPMCLGAIYCSKLSKVVYGAKRADVANSGFIDKYMCEHLFAG